MFRRSWNKESTSFEPSCGERKLSTSSFWRREVVPKPRGRQLVSECAGYQNFAWTARASGVEKSWSQRTLTKEFEEELSLNAI